ncbi:MAG: glycosyltransferase [Methylococcaceae bacterium]|nr:glycosyltransferase [Methylococcaceae bacterium]
MKPKLSIIVNFYNMQREAVRTLFSLTTDYQKGIHECDYEVIVVDSNSSQPLDEKWVVSIQKNFHYQCVESSWPSPCRAMNIGINMAKADKVVCIIDGARILSPGILLKMIQINNLYHNAFVQTIAMHIGSKVQPISVEEGYDQKVEDKHIATVNWQLDGYELFNISCLALSSKEGFFSPLPESNCFCAPKKKLLEIGGFDEKFKTPGGGLVNFDILNNILKDPQIQPIMLLGEATFHQFHGGVATNVPRAKHPMKLFLQEYLDIRDLPYNKVIRKPIYFGDIHENAMKFVFNVIET